MMLTIDELKSIVFFENLNEKELKLLLSITRKRSFSQGEILFYEKDKAQHLTMVLEGVVKIYKIDPKNNEIILHRFRPKSMVAEMAVFEGIPYPASAAFESDGSVLEIDFEKFKEYFLGNQDISLALFKSLTQKIKHLDNVIALNVVLDSTARVAKYICENDEALKMKNNQLAQYLHMTPETLSRILKKFTKLGFVKKEASSYKITNKEALTILFE
ncbi:MULTISPECIES: Crp/Fnr family transcriptional regulator [Sulfurimonas]|uniref:Crp/Fnr family transcriptional regulator n=1 Tax=Sulfurimonas TaxID=202746 RepID=UPI00125FAFCF|nr:Crp/Fnr family transcriptional regulator [Sulfurimonas hydrogeniphila]